MLGFSFRNSQMLCISLLVVFLSACSGDDNVTSPGVDNSVSREEVVDNLNVVLSSLARTGTVTTPESQAIVIPIDYSASDIQPEDLTITVNSSSDTTLLPLTNIVVDSHSVTVTPAAGIVGTAIVNVTFAHNSGVSLSKDFTVVVTNVNERPELVQVSYEAGLPSSTITHTLAQLINNVQLGVPVSQQLHQVTNEDTQGSIRFVVADNDIDQDNVGDYSQITAWAVSSNQRLIANAGINVTTDPNNSQEKIVTFTPVSNAFGNAIITVNYGDGELSDSFEFAVTVNPVNDNPVLGGIKNATTREDTTILVPVNAFDLETPRSKLVVNQAMLGYAVNSAVPSSSNNLIQSVSFDASGKFLVVVPAQDQYGEVDITVAINDDGRIGPNYPAGTGPVLSSNSQTFTLNIKPVNDAPYINNVVYETLYEDNNSAPTDPTSGAAVAPTLLVSFTIGDVDNTLAELSFDVLSKTVGLLPNSNITVSRTNISANEERVEVSGLAIANGFGKALLRARVQDNSNRVAKEIFELNFQSVNDTPLLAAIASQSVDEDQKLVVRFDASDIETPTANLTVTAVTTNNTGLLETADVVVRPGNRSMLITPKKNQSGTATITVNVADADGATILAPRTFDITVNPINDTPTIEVDTSQSAFSINEDDPEQTFTVVTDDADVGDTLTISAQSLNGRIDNSSIVVDQSAKTVKFTPKANENGQGRILVKVTDAAGASSQLVADVNIAAVNDVPTFDPISDASVDEDRSVVVPFTVNDVETPTGELNVSVAVLAPTPAALLEASDIENRGNRNLKITPKPGQSGVATIEVTMDDGEAAPISQQFTLTVNPVNDRPKMDAVPAINITEDDPEQSFVVTINDDDSGDTHVLTASASNRLIDPGSISVDQATKTVRFTPAANAYGDVRLILEATDSGGLKDRQSVAVSIAAVNDAPTLAAIADATIDEDGVARVNLNINDLETRTADLNVQVSSSNSALVDSANMLLSSGKNKLTIRPVAGASGSTTITVSVSDGEAPQVTQSFALTVNPVNDRPEIDPVVAQNITEDDGPQSFSVTVRDPDLGDTLTVTARSLNSRIDNASVSVTGNTVNYTPVANAFGLGRILVTVTDSEGASSNTTVDINIASVNDLPTLAAIADQSMNEDTVIRVPFSANDVETALGQLDIAITITPAVGSENLFGPDSVQVKNQRELRIAPQAGESGSATIELTVTDNDGASVSQNFNLTVSAVNDVPVLSRISRVEFDEDALTRPVVNFSVSDQDSDPLTVTVTSDNQALIADGDIALDTADLQNSTITFTNVPADAFGVARLTVTADDGNGGVATRVFTVKVNSVNDRPTLSKIAPSTLTMDEDGEAIINIDAQDVDKPTANLIVTAESDNPALISSLDIRPINGKTQLRLRPIKDMYGTATITVKVSDGELMAQEAVAGDHSFTLQVTNINDAPSISKIATQRIDEDAPMQVVNFQVGDGETGAASLTVTATSNNTQLLNNININPGATAVDRVLDFTVEPEQFGRALVTVVVEDAEGLTATEQFVVFVKRVDDKPVFDITGMSANETIDEDTKLVIPLVISDVDTAMNRITVSITSDNATLIDSSDIKVNAARTELTLIPKANESGAAQITINVADASSMADDSHTLTLNVTEVPDPPVMSKIATLRIDEDSSGSVGFNVSDDETVDLETIGITLTSSNTALINNGQSGAPGDGFAISQSGGSRTITITPEPDQYGRSEVTVRATDTDGDFSEQMFVVVVKPINDTPVLTNAGSVTAVNMDEDTHHNEAIQVSDVEQPNSGLRLNVVSNNTALIDERGVKVDRDRTELTFVPKANQVGLASVEVYFTDNRGKETGRRTFDISVNDINDAPVIEGDLSLVEFTELPGGNVQSIDVYINDVDTNNPTPQSSVMTVETQGDKTLFDDAQTTLTHNSGNHYTLELESSGVSGYTELVLLVKDSAGLASEEKTLAVGKLKVVVSKPLNDTGITQCGDYAFNASNNHNNDVDCTSGDSDGDVVGNGQDAQIGRDAVVGVDNSNGLAGFEFTRLNADGSVNGVIISSFDANTDGAISAGEAQAAYASQPWTCVRDEQTGLIWEVKTAANAGDQLNYSQAQSYEQAPALATCGSSKPWRLPSHEELQSIVNYQTGGAEPAYFPYASSARYWSNTVLYKATNRHRVINFAIGDGYYNYNSSANAVILVK